MALKESLFTLFFLLISLVGLISSFELDFFSGGTIGPGLMPQMISILLLILILAQAVVVMKGKKEEKDPVTQGSTFKKHILLIALIICTLLFAEKIGLLLSLGILIFLASFFIEKLSLIKTIVFTLVTMIMLYLIFVQWLGINLPLGILT